MAEATLDGRTVQSQEELHKALAEKLRFPEWYGKNLDALFDCLTDLHEETTLRILHIQALREQLGTYTARVLQVLEDAAGENVHFHLIVEMDEP